MNSTCPYCRQELGLYLAGDFDISSIRSPSPAHSSDSDWMRFEDELRLAIEEPPLPLPLPGIFLLYPQHYVQCVVCVQHHVQCVVFRSDNTLCNIFSIKTPCNTEKRQSCESTVEE